MKHTITLKVNGETRRIDVEPWQTLLDVLRQEFRFAKTKEGCGVGECGSCTVSMDRKTINSCLVLAVDADGKEIVTLEGLTQDTGFHPLMEAFIDQGAMRASFASPGKKTRHEYFTFCHLCCGHCSVKAIVEDGKVVDIAPDLESGLPSELCPVKKSRLAIPEILSHKERVIYPQKRVGARGEGKWQRISWEEALDTIARKFLGLREKMGPESLAICLGEPKGLEFAFGQRFAGVLGTPNVVTPGWSCGTPMGQSAGLTYGWSSVPDEETLPKLIVIWGSNPVHTTGGMRRESMAAALNEGAKLAVVDPKRIDMADVADIWVRVRPSGDGALAMGLLKVIVEEKLYDREIVENWTVGFDKLSEHLRTFTLDDVEKVSWVPRRQVEELARLYGTVKPAVLQWGNALDMVQHSFQTGRALAILRAITGNLNIPGGEVFLTPAPFTRPGSFFLLKKYPRRAERILGKDYKVAQYSAFIPPHTLTKTILSGEPYAIKAAMCILTNPIVSYPNSKETFDAFMKLDFLVVSELFMTPTAALADIVLPVAWGMEHEELGYWPGWYEEIRVHPKIVDPPGECWPDTKIINELAKRMGFREDFWENDEEALDAMLEPSGLTYEQLKEERVLHARKEYKKHQYRTPSGKVEIYSEQLKKMGYEPMPRWENLSILDDTSEEYPLLLTNAKEEGYMLTSYKHVASLRKVRPEPVAELNPKTAQKLGLNEGEWVYLETAQGKIKQKLSLNRDIEPRVVYAAFGWWFPEEERESVCAWDRSNINVLTPSGPEYDPETGSLGLRGLPCRVYRAEE